MHAHSTTTMDTLPTFRTAFSPVKYGEDSALMLNGLQWVVECYGGWNYTPRDEGLAACNYPESRVFSLAQGTELEADLLTMHFLGHPTSLVWRMHQCLSGNKDLYPSTEGKNTANFLQLIRLFMPKVLRACGDGVCLRQAYLAQAATRGSEGSFTREIASQVGLLRQGLYRRPRAVAFTSGMRGRLGSGSEVRSLSDELCKWILELSFAE